MLSHGFRLLGTTAAAHRNAPWSSNVCGPGTGRRCTFSGDVHDPAGTAQAAERLGGRALVVQADVPDADERTVSVAVDHADADGVVEGPSG